MLRESGTGENDEKRTRERVPRLGFVICLLYVCSLKRMPEPGGHVDGIDGIVCEISGNYN